MEKKTGKHMLMQKTRQYETINLVSSIYEVLAVLILIGVVVANTPWEYIAVYVLTSLVIKIILSLLRAKIYDRMMELFTPENMPEGFVNRNFDWTGTTIEIGTPSETDVTTGKEGLGA